MEGLVFELKKTLYEIHPARWNWRRARSRVLPVAAVAASGLGALAGYKQLRQSDPNLIISRAGWQCVSSEELSRRQLLPHMGLCRERLQSAGADVSGILAAAGCLMGPIERDLMVAEYWLAGLQAGEASATAAASVEPALVQVIGAECVETLRDLQDPKQRQQALYDLLVELWKDRGYLEPPPRRPKKFVDPMTQTDDTYGRDVGCQLPHCLLRAKEQRAINMLDPEAWKAASDSLWSTGAVLLHSVLPTERISELRAGLGVQTSALDAAAASSSRSPFPPVREYTGNKLFELDPELDSCQSTPGRRHYQLRGTRVEGVVRDVQAGLLPLVWQHLARAAADMRYPPSAKPYISEVQLLISDPCAAEQFWHVDNGAAGLTAYVPLTSLPAEMGVMMLLPGTHHLFSSSGFMTRWSSWAASFFEHTDGVATVTMDAGDALLYDCRVLHRTTANRLYNRTGLMLVIRYDYERPPGMGIAKTELLSLVGNWLAGLMRLYARLPGGGSASTPLT